MSLTVVILSARVIIKEYIEKRDKRECGRASANGEWASRHRYVGVRVFGNCALMENAGVPLSKTGGISALSTT
jgi:hypothetical protein